MALIFSTLLGIFLLLFSSTVNAQSFGAKLCKSNNETYSCYKVKHGDTWAKLFPDEDERDLVTRVNRTNNRLYSGMVIAIPKNLQDTDMLDYAPFSAQRESSGNKLILVSLEKLAFGAYDANGNLEYWGPISGGKGYCPDLGRGCHTAKGSFEIYRKLGAGCVSSKFPIGRGGAPMPYCMFFHGGFALHGSYDIPGYNASHGCVRLFVKDAKWLNQEFVQDDDVAVVIQ
jgi:L,D-transpeptidase ErfK/SrfK